MKATKVLLFAASALLAPTAAGQGLLGHLPFQYSGDLFVTDSSSDSIMRCMDLDMNGDYNGPGETTAYYSDAIGPLALGNNSGITVGLDGQLFVSDTTQDQIFRLVDLNGDGTCHDPGEAFVFFDGDPLINLSGLGMVSSSDLTVDMLGRVYIAAANNSGGGTDSIIVLTDINGDGDANDVGEATNFYQPSLGSGSTGDSIPNDLLIGGDGHIYYIEGGSTGVIPKAVYRLDDLNGDGTIDPLTEVTTFFTPPTQSGTPFFWSLTQDSAGYFYTADSGNDLIWRFKDTNGDGTVDPLTEAVIWWTALDKSLIWDVTASSDGALYCAESQSPDRVLRMYDTDGNGIIDPLTEVTEVYSELLSPTNIVNPRGLIFEQAPNLTTSGTAALGAPVSLVTRGTLGDIVSTWWAASSMAPLPILPFGNLELGLFPGSPYGILYTGTIGAGGGHDPGFTMPTDPAFAGVTFYLQGFVGKLDRLQFTNLGSVTAL